jgi:hypothetical protein
MSTWLYQGRVNGEFCLMGVTDIPASDSPVFVLLDVVVESIGKLFKPNEWNVSRVRYEGKSGAKSLEMTGDHYGDHFVITAERTA